MRTTEFKRMLESLPVPIQGKAQKLFEFFKKNPHDPILENEELHDSKKGRHRNASHSVSITRRYRAIYVVDNGPRGDQETQCCWYWVGSHEDYSTFLGCR